MQGPRIGVVTGTLLGSAFIEGLVDGLGAARDGGASLSLLLGLHPSQAPAIVGYADVLQINGCHFETVLYFTSTKSVDFDQAILRANLDFLLVVSVSQLVSDGLVAHHTAWIEVPGGRAYRRACIGAHPSPLPIGRGRAPIPWTILEGLTDSALTTFVLGDGADDGPIVSRHAFDIATSDTATTLYEKVRRLHAMAGTALAAQFGEGIVVATPQDHARATQWPKRTAADAHISSTSGPEAIRRLVAAAQPPYQAAFIVLGAHRLDIARTQAIAGDPAAPQGTVLRVTTTSLDVRVAGGSVRLFPTTTIPPEIGGPSCDRLLVP